MRIPIGKRYGIQETAPRGCYGNWPASGGKRKSGTTTADSKPKIREEQACLRNQIRDWAKLDSEVIQLGEEKLTAHQAAKECSLKQERHGWLPDKLSPDTIPPLNDHELRELCQELKDINPEDTFILARLE